MLALLSRLSSYRRGVGWVSSPGQGKDRSGSGKKMGAGPVSLALLSSEGWFPRKFVLSPSTPSFGRSQQQSSPKKMLVMATAPANSGQTLAHQLWSIEGGEGGGARAGTEVGLGWRPDHYSTVKVARFPAAAASWFVLRGNGEMEGRNPLYSRVSSPPLLSLVGRKVGWGGGWGVDVGGGVLPLLGGGKKRKLLPEFGFLQLLRASHPLTHLDPGPQNPRYLLHLGHWPSTLLPLSQ